MSVIGVDLGGSKIAVGRFSNSWKLEEKRRREVTPGESFPAVFAALVDEVKALQTDGVIALGVGVPGLIHQPQGVIHTTPNIPGGEQFPLREKLEKATGLLVAVDNDANCFALASAKLGFGKGKKVVVGITVGTGVGGGIVIDGKPFRGAHGFAAEIGHMLLRPGQPPYPTQDMRGEVEQFFSGKAMGKRCEAARDPNDYLEGEVCAFMHKDIYKEVAWMCCNLTHLLDPDIIVFGGRAGRALAPHLDGIRVELTQWLLPGTPVPELAIETLPDAELLGAALLTSTKH